MPSTAKSPTLATITPAAIDWPRFVELIRGCQSFVLTSHIRPDCDALGSELGMAGILAALGKEVRIVNGQKTPPNLAWIDPQQRILALDSDVSLEDLDSADAVFVLDTSAWAQLGPMGDALRRARGKKLVLDHHVSSDDLGAEYFKDPTIEATGRLVFEAAQQLGVSLTPEIATPLFAALATDTGWFRFGSTRGDTYRVAGQLVDAGASPPAIWKNLYEDDTLARVRLMGRILERTTTELDGRFVYTWVELRDFDEVGALPSDTEDIINMTLQIGGTQVAVILVELRSGGVKVSFRSRAAAVDCSRLAEQFQGGGHKAAA
ncbi:MAG: DHH family phosphoesterase, partial [Planctomycetaceae bacterium]|nr:DHH family phosphoesterase [Planctomycetaceae bacterium]